MSSLLPDTLNPATLLSKRFRPEQIPDLTGRVALVTGGSGGIGYWDVAHLAQHGAKVHFVSANTEHGKQAQEELNKALQESGSKGSFVYHHLDMSKIRSVDSWVKKFAQEESRLDILVANAGIGQAPWGITDDGLERHFETAATATPATVRIVTQSSEMHRFAPSNTKFTSKEEINEKGDGVQLYGRTKLGLIVLVSELVRRKLTDTTHPILAISVHPGMVDTELQVEWQESYGPLGAVVDKLSRLGGKSAEEGAEASRHCLETQHALKGKYYTEPYGKPDQETNQAKDQTLANNFWELCADLTEELLGERLE